MAQEAIAPVEDTCEDIGPEALMSHPSRLAVVALAAILNVSLSSQDNSSDAFYAAIRSNDLAKLRALVSSDANINIKDERGITPLMYAGWVGSSEAMKVLLDHHADPNLTNSSGSTALMLSVTEIAKVRLLLDHHADVNAASSKGRTPLLLAAMNDRSAAVVRLLMNAGADAKTVDTFKVTALHAAALGNDIETIRLMLDAGLDANAVDFLGFTPLLYASNNGNLAAVRLLLAKGANVNAVSIHSLNNVKAGPLALGKFTPLIVASPFGSTELVTTLLEAGANVNVQDARGMTPLMLAVATDTQKPEKIRAILQKGASLNVKSVAHETALDWARKIGAKPAIELLEHAGAIATPAPAPVVAPFSPADMKTAAQRSLTLMEKTSIGAATNGGCASCHHQNITDIAASLARPKGLLVDEKASADRRQLTTARFFPPLNLLERIDGAGAPVVPLYALEALAAAGYRPDRITDGIVTSICGYQRADGHWSPPLGGVARPPIEDGDIPRTVVGIGALKAYGAPGRAADVNERIARAAKWLAAAKPMTTDDRNMQLIGLESVGAERALLQRLANAILSQQRADGGWSQRPDMQSDAYATGETLFALASTRLMSPTEAAFQKGAGYLLSTQHADGSWYVRSRSPKFQPYFESGFPYGHDQWISAMATGWATAALTFALESPQRNVQLDLFRRP
jgi:ankyrin repeat protein